MSATDRQRRWRAANPGRATATRRAYRVRPEVKDRLNRQYRATHPPRPPAKFDSDAERARDWRSRNYARYMFSRCRGQAKKNGIPFDLTPEFLERLIAPMRCSVTGVELIVAPRGSRHPLLPSIDQIKPGGGYTQNNVRLVSWIYNRSKGSGTDSEVLDMALALVSHCVKHRAI